jgi:hypothetical protein
MISEPISKRSTGTDAVNVKSGEFMDNNKENASCRKPEPERVQALKTLPPELMSTLTREEVHAFLFEDVWPDSLQTKLKDYLE